MPNGLVRQGGKEVKKVHILICDDELGVRDSLRLILGDRYLLAFAKNGQEAVEYAKTHDVDVAIMDVKMPKMGGLDALPQLKKIRPRIQILMATGYESSDVATQAINLGADDYIVKPFDRDKVLAKIQAFCGKLSVDK